VIGGALFLQRSLPYSVSTRGVILRRAHQALLIDVFARRERARVVNRAHKI
jgi:hypothetical protein